MGGYNIGKGIAEALKRWMIPMRALRGEGIVIILLAEVFFGVFLFSFLFSSPSQVYAFIILLMGLFIFI